LLVKVIKSDPEYQLFRRIAMSNNQTYLTTDELAARIKYDARTIRESLKDSVLIEGQHYIRPFGGRKILYLWDAIEKDMCMASRGLSISIPMTNGGVLYG
jgi:hypothetical protein